MSANDLSNGTVVVSSSMLALAFLCVLYRVIRGPTLPDRVIALDFLAILAIGSIATFVTATGQDVYLDVAIAVALTAFLGTVAFARYLERSRLP